MPLIRGHHEFDDHYTQLPNAWLRDNRLSFKARGLIALVMSHAQGWSLSVNTLAEQNQEGKDAIRSAIVELETLGYLSRTQVNDAGRFGESIWTTHDPADLPMTENPMTDNPTPKKNILKEEQVKNTKELKSQMIEKQSKPRAHPLPEDFRPSEKSYKLMSEHFPWVDLKLETHAFRAYWLSTSKNSNKTNWDMTWENWIRNCAKWNKVDAYKKLEKPTAKRKFGVAND
jgi:hypothetical protein